MTLFRKRRPASRASLGRMFWEQFMAFQPKPPKPLPRN
jgi:hypothetical protein